MSKVIQLPSNGGGTVTHVRLTPGSGDLEGKEDEGRVGVGGKGEGRGGKEEERRKQRKKRVTEHLVPDRPGGYHTGWEILLTWLLEWGIRRAATCRP